MVHPPNTPFDLIISAGRVICPESGIDDPGYVAIRGDRIVAVGMKGVAIVCGPGHNSYFALWAFLVANVPW